MDDEEDEEDKDFSYSRDNKGGFKNDNVRAGR